MKLALALGLLSAPPLPAQAPLLSFAHDPAEPSYALRTAAVGDLDGDGFGDVAIASPRSADFDGRVVVHSGRDGSRLLLLEGPRGGGAHFGWSVTGLADVDGDGTRDLAVGMQMDARGGRAAGAVSIRSGRTGAVLAELLGDGPGDFFGSVLAVVGDVDADGAGDLAVGAPENGDPVLNYGPGYARVFSGRDFRPLLTVRGTAPADEFGSSLAGVGDLDHDGHADFAVGSLLELSRSNAQGSARVFSGRDGTALYDWFAEPLTDHFGMSLALVGDVDRDGSADLAIGSINAFSFIKGAVWLASGRDGSVLRVVRGAADSAMFGWRVVAAGDVDRDGVADLLVSDPMHGADRLGAVHVVSGTGRVLGTVHGPSPGSGFGSSLDLVGDLDGDGIDEFAVGAPGAGANGTVVVLTHAAAVARFGAGCGHGTAPALDASVPVAGSDWFVGVKEGGNRRLGVLAISPAPALPVPIGAGCTVYLDPRRADAIAELRTDRQGAWGATFSLPASPALRGVRLALQAALADHRAALGVALSNGLYVTVQ